MGPKEHFNLGGRPGGWPVGRVGVRVAGWVGNGKSYPLWTNQQVLTTGPSVAISKIKLFQMLILAHLLFKGRKLTFGENQVLIQGFSKHKNMTNSMFPGTLTQYTTRVSRKKV